MEYLSRVSAKFSEINEVNYKIAFRYENGTGVIKNSNKAFNYYSKINSDYHKIAEVYHRLGHLYAIGANNNEGTIDYTLATNFYYKGANLNNTECMRHLGDFYNKGGKLEENLTLSKKWYQKACDLKNEKAFISLNKMEYKQPPTSYLINCGQT